MSSRCASGREAAAFRCQAVADPRERIRDLRLSQLTGAERIADPREQIRDLRLDQLLERFCDLAGLEAAGADVRTLGLPAQVDADALEVRIEAALRGHHGVAAAVPERRFLPAHCTDLRHGRGSLADGS